MKVHPVLSQAMIEAVALKRYLFTYFVPDLLSSIPYHIEIFYPTRMSQQPGQMKLLFQYTSLFKITRCVTLYVYSKRSVEKSKNIYILIIIFVLAQLIAIISSVKASNIKYRQMVQQLHEYMRYRQLPENLQRRLISYYEFRFEKSYFRESEILNSVSGQLRQVRLIQLFNTEASLLYLCTSYANRKQNFRNV
ncbi:i[[h]] channel isoform e [Holotrichia oblita]|uniref:I[[h]] channel isoform e n=1 Tax=Holotrichia oblita TaxID=644536 RepID=A0ACB9TWD6_HOLOL|nr:i[[h]] channel isoform e [Holotrichia oblita]